VAAIRIENDTLFVDLGSWEALWALHGSFAIPLRSVVGASTAKPPSFWDSLKIMGTNWPGNKMAGTMVYHGEVAFFDFRGDEDAVLVVDVAGGKYKHLFVHVDDPEGVAKAINEARAPAAETERPAI
jgi:hypothetical protein